MLFQILSLISFFFASVHDENKNERNNEKVDSNIDYYNFLARYSCHDERTRVREVGSTRGKNESYRAVKRMVLTLKVKLLLVKVGRLSASARTSTLKARTLCRGGRPASVAFTDTRYTLRSS